MGDPIKAEQSVKHFAVAVSPALAATPFGQRQVPSVPAVSFAVAVAAAQKSFGHDNPLFLLRSTAVDMGKTFKPTEFLPQNPVEGSHSTSHGHMGVITFASGGSCPGAINCGVLRGGNAECGADLANALDALVERMTNELMASPLDFYSNYRKGESTVGAVLAENASSMLDGIKSGWNKAGDYFSANSLSQIGLDALKASETLASFVPGTPQFNQRAARAAQQAADWVKGTYNEFKDLNREDLKAACKAWLLGLLGELTCSMVDLLAGMAGNPKPVAEQLGEAVAVAEAMAVETAAAAAVDVLVTKGATSASAKIGKVLYKVGGKLDDAGAALYRELKKVQAAKRKPELPGPRKDGPVLDKPSGQTPSKPTTVEPQKPTPSNDSSEGRADGQAKPKCLTCALGGPHPVNAIYGVKLLEGDQDLDFVIEAPLPMAWQRTYASSNANEGWLGHGWSVPLAFRLDVTDDAIVFVDMQGRRTVFPPVSVGQQFFSKYEHTTLKRTRRNQYELIGPDGLRLIFGLGPLDQARLEAREADEAKQAAYEARAWERLLADRAAQGEEPLPERQADAQDKRLPQADQLVLMGFIDPNHNHLRLHYAADGLPRHLDTSSGRRIGFVFDRSRPRQPRLTHMVELLGQPDSQGHYPKAQQQWLVEYRYSAEGDLVEVRDGDGQLGRTFAWQNHMLVEHAEPGGLVSRYTWDQLTPQGRVLKNTLSTGESWTFEYHERSTRVTDAGGRQRTYLFDAEKFYTGVIDPLQGRTRFERDIYGNLLAMIDPAGRVTRHLYDTRGNLIRVTQPDGAVYRLTYEHTSRQPVAITDPLERTTRYRYDARGNLVEIIEPHGARTEYRLDARGLPQAVIDARGGHKTFDVDAAGRLLAHTDCSGNRTQYSYDSRGNLASITNALGHNSQYGYQRINRRDRLSTLRHADGASERFAYDALGRLIAHQDPLGRVTRYQLDVRGRPLERIDALGHRLRYQYDLHGRLSTLHNENNAVYRFSWDVLDRLVAEQGFDGRRIDYRYGRTGQLLESADGVPLGAPLLGKGLAAPILRTRYQRDVMGRLLDKISSKPTPGGRTQIIHSRFAYDAAGQLVAARNGQARVERLYNLAGQLSRETIRSRGGQLNELQHRYDLLGNRESTTLPDGRELNTLSYGSGHVHQINLDFQPICDFERDALHREVSRTQGRLKSSFQLDPLGRLLQSQAQLQAQGQVSEPLVGGPSDPAKHTQGQRIARRYQYDLAGQLKSISDRRKGSTQYGYDVLGRLLSASAPHAQETFAFDPAHNLMQPDEARQQEARLKKTTWTDDEWRAYVRDNQHNPAFNPLLTPAEAAADPSTWGANKPNRLLVWEEHRYAYDTWGNCVEKKSGSHNVRTFQWDAEHRLSCATVVRQQGRFLHTEHWGYDYDPFGRRIAKYRLNPAKASHSRPWLDAHTTHFSWDGNRLLQERQGDKQTLYIYEPNSFVPLAVVRSTHTPAPLEQDIAIPAEWRGLMERHPEQWAAIVGAMPHKLAAMQPSANPVADAPKSPVEVFYVHTDHLGTPRELTDTTGRIVWAACYKAWGNTSQIEHPPQRVMVKSGNTLAERWQAQSDPIEQNLRFQGQYFDQETGLHYNRFRHYDPDCGRFVSQDPIGLAGGTNNYQYAPNPVGWIDPLGLDTRSDAIKLAENLTACGDARPNSRHRAHHIVMSNSKDPKMELLRKKMESLGIDINTAENGVWLPETTADRLPGSTKTSHKGEGVHGQDYQNTLYDLLIDTNTKDDFLEKLSELKGKLEGGAKFKLGCCCRLSAGG